MDVCNLEVDVSKIGAEQGDYFFPIFSKDPV